MNKVCGGLWKASLGSLALWNMSQMAARGWWIEARIVWPEAARPERCSIMVRAAKESRPVVGSSRNSSDGVPISAHAMPSRRFSPPAALVSTH